MSFLSAACQTCKSRHLKCDEAQPVCQRCVKSRRTCHRAGSIIHIENAFASREKKRPRGPRSKAIEEPSSRSQVILFKAPSVDIKPIAVNYYLQKHLRATPDLPVMMKGQSDDVMPLWTGKVENSLLGLAVSTMALAVFSRIHKHEAAAVEASSRYQNLLRTARFSLASINTTNIDIALLAIFFMGRFEDSMHLPENIENKKSFALALKSAPHHEGATAILKSWYDSMSTQQPPSNVIKHSRQGIIRSALMRSRPVPDWMVDGVLFGERDLALEYDRILVRVVNLRHRVTLLSGDAKLGEHTGNERTAMASELDEEIHDIEIAIQKWTRHFPSTWWPRRHFVETTHVEHIRTPFVHTYSNPAFAAIWNRVHAARMLVSSTRIDILQLTRAGIDPWTDQECQFCRSIIATTADEMSASIPFILQRFTVVDNVDTATSSITIEMNNQQSPEPYVAGMAAWPLSIASSLRHLDPQRKQWFRAELGAVGSLLGNKVFESVNSDQWLEL